MVFSFKIPKSLLFEVISLKYLVWRIKILCDKELINESVNGLVNGLNGYSGYKIRNWGMTNWEAFPH